MSRNGMPLGRLVAPIALGVLLGCAGAAPQVPPARPAPRAPKVISSEQRTSNDRQYFLAVSAYTRGDYDEALLIVKGILAIDPANTDALNLRRRIAAAKKAGGS